MEMSIDILVAEDEEHISFILGHALQRSSYNVKIVPNGKDAMTEIDTLPTPPKLVLLDIMMPYVDGISVLKKIRNTSGWEQVPVIMLTAKTQEKDIVSALNAGANDYITKPFQIGELLARVKRYVPASAA